MMPRDSESRNIRQKEKVFPNQNGVLRSPAGSFKKFRGEDGLSR